MTTATAPSNLPLQLTSFIGREAEIAEAKRLLGEMTEKAPDYLPAWRRLAEIAVAERRYDDATKALNVVLKRNAGDLDAHLLMGRVYLARSQTNQAIQEFRAVLKAEPRFAPAHYQLGLAQLQAGDVQQFDRDEPPRIHAEPRPRVALLAEFLVHALDLHVCHCAVRLDGGERPRRALDRNGSRRHEKSAFAD